jgi:hypothetical protein
MKKTIFLILIMLPFVVWADIYMWNDKNGVAHFSETPVPGAQRAQLENIQTYAAPILPVDKAPNSTANIKPNYKDLRIIQPADQQTILNNKQGDITIKIAVQPKLQNNHKFQLLLDGKVLLVQKQAVFKLNNIDRGTHTLQMQVIDKQNKILINSSAITIYVQRPHSHHSSI